jgi:hypothetical protein
MYYVKYTMLYNTYNIIVTTITALTTPEIGEITPGGSGTTSLVSELGPSDSLSNISFSMTRYDMPSSYNDAVQSRATYNFLRRFTQKR